MAEGAEARRHRRTDRGFDRFVNFSDAVVAIAISLLILPVVDAVADSSKADDAAREFFSDNSDRLIAFAISFLVIASFWVAHHKVFEEVKGYTPTLMWVNLAWLATIVFLPLPTEILAVQSADDRFVRFIYIASVLAVSVTMVALELVIDHAPEILIDPDVRRPGLAPRLAMPILLVVALLLGTFVEAIGLWAMFLTALAGHLAKLLDRSSARAT
jgi:uncharacterized membrane protein